MDANPKGRCISDKLDKIGGKDNRGRKNYFQRLLAVFDYLKNKLNPNKLYGKYI